MIEVLFGIFRERKTNSFIFMCSQLFNMHSIGGEKTFNRYKCLFLSLPVFKMLFLVLVPEYHVVSIPFLMISERIENPPNPQNWWCGEGRVLGSTIKTLHNSEVPLTLLPWASYTLLVSLHKVSKEDSWTTLTILTFRHFLPHINL